MTCTLSASTSRGPSNSAAADVAGPGVGGQDPQETARTLLWRSRLRVARHRWSVRAANSKRKRLTRPTGQANSNNSPGCLRGGAGEHT